MKKFDRREILKLLAYTSLSAGMPHFLRAGAGNQQAERPNVLIVVFDAMSAYHLQMYGYGRQTMPNLARLLDRGTVYHNHYAGGNFTTPGTASMLTGALPWTHRALAFYDEVLPTWQDRQIFNLFAGHHRIAYSHNPLVDKLLRQFNVDLDTYLPFQDLLLANYWLADVFGEDFDTASLSFGQIVENAGYVSNTLFLKQLYMDLVFEPHRLIKREYKKHFPVGVPVVARIPYDLETGMNWMMGKIGEIPQPFLGYFHFFPPHDPYKPPNRSFNAFKQDGFMPVEKPEHPYFSMGVPDEELNNERRLYDEFILYVDDEFGRLFDYLENSGLMENTWVVFTSDHGELFERGILAHSTHAMNQPVVRVPLVIFGPGQQERHDIYQPTSAVDILPTLLALNSYEIPEWIEGDVLPPYRKNDLDPSRPVFSVNAREELKYGDLSHSSLVMVKGAYKLTRYIGYEELEGETYYELFDLQEDPQELVNLMAVEPETAQAMVAELEEKIADVNARNSG